MCADCFAGERSHSTEEFLSSEADFSVALTVFSGKGFLRLLRNDSSVGGFCSNGEKLSKYISAGQPLCVQSLEELLNNRVIIC
jgi:hypothetical protein